MGRDPVTGKRRQVWRSVQGTKRDAEGLLARLLHERNTGVDLRPEPLTVAQYLERWLRDAVEPNVEPKTLRTATDIVRRHLLPSLGRLRLQQLRPAHIQAYYTEKLRAGRLDGRGGLSPSSVLRHHQVLHAALRRAVRWQLLAVNPADAVEPPRVVRQRRIMPEAEDVRRLLSCAHGSPAGPIVRMAVLTGMRLGEILGLRWADVDLDAGVIHVQQTAQRVPGQGIVFKAPKTARSRRSVAISPDTVRFLRDHRRRQLEERMVAGRLYEDHGLVFCTPLGRPLDQSHVRRAWSRLKREAGLDDLRLHDLRHLHATLMLRLGAHPKVVSERLGHASVGITLDVYSHVLPTIQAAAAEQLDQLLAPTPEDGG